MRGAGRRIGALARTATLILVLLVMAGSAAAFAISEGLKVQKAAITAVQIPTRIFSPVCDCPTDRVSIAFRLTRRDRLTVGIVDSHGQIVRTLVPSKLFGRGKHHFTWNGLTNVGAVVPDGVYEPRIRLHRAARRSCSRIRSPSTRPAAHRAGLGAPANDLAGRDGHSDVVHVRYRIDERAHALLFVNGIQRARTKFQRQRDTIDWYGKVLGRALRPGNYRLSLAAVDLAGNSSRVVPAGRVRIRYVELPLNTIRAKAGARWSSSGSRPTRRMCTTRSAAARAPSPPGAGPRRLVLRAPEAGPLRARGRSRRPPRPRAPRRHEE